MIQLFLNCGRRLTTTMEFARSWGVKFFSPDLQVVSVDGLPIDDERPINDERPIEEARGILDWFESTGWEDE